MITRHQERKLRIYIAIDVITKSFQKLLELKIAPNDLMKKTNEIKDFLNKDQLLIFKSEQYHRFDISLIYEIFQNLGEYISLDGPTTRWENTSMLKKKHTTTSDDLKRIILYRNKYYHEAAEEEITEAKLEEVKNDLIEISKRIQDRTSPFFIGVNYIEQIEDVFTTDSNRLENIETRLTQLEQGRKRKHEEDWRTQPIKKVM
ncbi:uncharacterized protein LOC134279788, partial [Saccostrea cucullata]|uniref:uncharacterized protein LOC134279788 n=1 Tax=Saccostrea cuccullata TaxID=36930 RepID=UPI002ED2EEF7